MLTALDIKNVNFSNSRRGYNKEEVDVFLDSVEADYLQFENILKDYRSKVEELNSKIDEYKNSQNSIQNVLMSAQRLADQIVNEAKEKSEEIILNAEKNISAITAREKELSNAFELKAVERKAALQKELDDMTTKANLKSESIAAATAEALKQQQIIFDKLKLETAAFKSAISEKYKEHLKILQDIPDTLKMTPEEMAEIISAKIDDMPDLEEFIPAEKSKVVENNIPENTDGFSVESLLTEEKTAVNNSVLEEN